MERRRAVAIAAATAATTVAAVAAIAVNVGLLGSSTTGPAPLGQLDAGAVAGLVGAASTAPGQPAADVVVRYEDVYLPAPAVPAQSPPPGAGTGDPPDAAVPVEVQPGEDGWGGDDDGHRDGEGDDDHDGDGHDDGDRDDRGDDERHGDGEHAGDDHDEDDD